MKGGKDEEGEVLEEGKEEGRKKGVCINNSIRVRNV